MNQVSMNSPRLDIGSAHSQIKNAYSKWGIPPSFFKNHQVVDHASFLKLLDSIQHKIPEINCRVMPASFDPDESNLLAFPYHLSANWDTCKDILNSLDVEGVMSRLSLFWQVETLLHTVCRAAKTFLFLNDSGNMPLGEMALAIAEVDTIVTDIEDSVAFASHLALNSSNLGNNWIIIHPLRDRLKKIPEVLKQEEINVIQEVHIFPGVSVLTQCPHLWSKKQSIFHISDAYTVENNNGNLLITSTDAPPFPFYRYELPHSLNEIGRCKCGKIIYAIRQ